MPRHVLKRVNAKPGSTCVTRKGVTGAITKKGSCYPSSRKAGGRKGPTVADLRGELLKMGGKIYKKGSNGKKLKTKNELKGAIYRRKHKLKNRASIPSLTKVGTKPASPVY